MKGILLTADLFGCEVCPGDRKELTELSVEAVKSAGLHVDGQVGGSFGKHRWKDMAGASELTLMVPLLESHLAVHTFTADRYVAIDIFTCGAESGAEQAIMQLIAQFRPARTVRNRLKRGRGS